MELKDLTSQYEASNRAREFSKLIFAHGMAGASGQPVSSVIEYTPGLERWREKATVGGGSTTSLAPLAGDIAARAFVNLLERQTVPGRLTGALSAPPNMLVPTITTDPIATWIGQGVPMPLAMMAFSDPRTSISKFGILLAFTRELFRVADDRAVNVIERISLRALRRAEDALFLSSTAAVTDVSPAGLLNGLASVGSGSPLSIADLAELWTAVSSGDPDRPYFVTSPRAAIWLASRHVDGVPQFPNISALTGGDIAGVPVLLSRAAGSRLILIDAAQLAVTDEGLAVDQSEQAAIQFLDNPTNNAASGVATNVVSAFQASAVILRFVRWLHWTKLTSDAVAFIDLEIEVGSPA